MGKAKTKERRSLLYPDQTTTDDNEVTNSSTGAVKSQEKVLNVGVPNKIQKKRKIDVKKNQDSNDSANSSTEIEPSAKRLALPIAIRNVVTTATMSASVTARKGADKQKKEERSSSREQQLRTVLTRLGEKRTIIEADDGNRFEQEPPSKKLALVGEKGSTVVAKNKRNKNMNSRGAINETTPNTLTTVAATKPLEKAKKQVSSTSSGWSSRKKSSLKKPFDPVPKKPVPVKRKEESSGSSDSSSEEEGAVKKPTAVVSKKQPVPVKGKEESSESSDSSSEEEGAVKKPTAEKENDANTHVCTSVLGPVEFFVPSKHSALSAVAFSKAKRQGTVSLTLPPSAFKMECVPDNGDASGTHISLKKLGIVAEKRSIASSNSFSSRDKVLPFKKMKIDVNNFTCGGGAKAPTAMASETSVRDASYNANAGSSGTLKSKPARLPNVNTGVDSTPKKLTAVAGAETPNSFKQRLPFRRVEDDACDVLPELADNSFAAKKGAQGSWGERADMTLKFTRGKDFRHEKTKKKRGTYSGGVISTAVCSFKFKE